MAGGLSSARFNGKLKTPPIVCSGHEKVNQGRDWKLEVATGTLLNSFDGWDRKVIWKVGKDNSLKL